MLLNMSSRSEEGRGLFGQCAKGLALVAAASAALAVSAVSAAAASYTEANAPAYLDAADPINSIYDTPVFGFFDPDRLGYIELYDNAGSGASADGFAPNDFGGPNWQECDFIDTGNNSCGSGSVDEAAGYSGSALFDVSQVGFSNRNFQFALDINEPGGQRTFSLDRITIIIDGVTIYDYDPIAVAASYLTVNCGVNCGGTAGETRTPLGTGVDLVFKLPFDTIVAQAGSGAVSGASQIEFKWIQSNDSAGGDQWILLSDGIGDRLCTDPLDPTCTINEIPVPGALPLIAGALGMLGLIRLNRRGQV